MDHLSNLLSIIQNGSERGDVFVKYYSTKYLNSILDKLLDEGLIRGYRFEGEYTIIYLKYLNGRGLIKKIKRVSKRGKRVYMNKNMLLVKALKGEYIFYSATGGIFCNIDLVLNKTKKGGEVLFSVKLVG